MSSNAASTPCKQWRGITTRYDKRSVNYRAGSVIASVILWIKT
jgi:transposase